MLIASLVVLGIVVIVFVASRVVGQLDTDPYNRQVLGAAEELMAQGRWTDAQEYLIKNADPDGNFYPEIQKRIRELQLRTPDYHQQQNELAARKLHTRLGLKIRSCDRGGMGTRPEDILKIVERMKTEFAATEQTRLAKEEYPAWFAGKVPQRASEYLASGGQLKRDWDQALLDSKEWEKDWRFREAREAIERFLSVREAVLAADELEYYRGKADQQLSRLDLAADGIYRAQERRSWDLLKNRRYDEAILLFKAVIEKFGLDAYVRKAQAEIRKIEEQKKNPSGS